MIERPEYLNQLIRFKDKDLIKIVTGIKRCGKSTLFDLYIEYLLKSGIDKKQITRINLEEYEFIDMENYKQLYEYINAKLIHDKKNYVFIDEGHILENVVYLELLRRGYEIYIGKNDDSEVDFVVSNEKGEEYYQVSYTVRNEKTLERELKALNSINDHNPKYLLTADNTPYTSYNGIKQINVFEWLLDK